MIAVGRVALLSVVTASSVTGTVAVTEASDTSSAAGYVSVEVALLTENVSTTDTTSYATASISPLANSLILACVGTEIGSGAAPTVTVSGLSLTWTQIPGATTTASAGNRRLAIFYADAGSSPGSGALTLTMVDAGAGTTAVGCGWSILQVTGHATTPAFAQVAADFSGSGVTSYQLTLADALDGRDAVVSWWRINANEAVTSRTDWTELSDRGHAAPTIAYETQWRPAGFGNDDTSISWTTSSQAAGVAVEIAIAGSVVGSSAATEAADTSSATGTLTITGTVAVTEAADTSTATGTLTITGTVAVTEAADTSTASGTLTITGTVAVTEAADTSTASGTVASAEGIAAALARTSSFAPADADSTFAPAGAVATLAPATVTRGMNA